MAGTRLRAVCAAGTVWACLAALPARGAPALYAGEGGWAAATGLPATAQPPAAGEWSFQDGVWIGRVPAGTAELDWGGTLLRTAAALPPPAPPIALPATRNAFGACAVRSLSIRYDSAVRSRRWSLVFNDDERLDPLALPDRAALDWALELEDVATGRRWPLAPTRRGREGGRFPGRNDPRIFAGTLDEGDIDWSLVVVPQANGRQLVQGQVMLLKSDERRFRLRLFVRAGAPGAALLQDESPPAILAVRGEQALGLFPDLAEPRRYRAAAGAPDMAGIEYDLAATKATGNFPRRAAFALEVEAWKTADPETARREAAAKLARAGGGVAVPETLLREGLGSLAALEPAVLRLTHPGGFRSGADALGQALLKASGLFRDFEWAASAYQCVAKDAAGEPRVVRSGDDALVAVNPDPDLDALLELGQNRGQTLLERVRRSGAPAAWIRAGALPGQLDSGARALYLCDYPAVWDADTGAVGVELGHAEAELIASLACALKAADTCLLVEDGGPLAPFTTYYADALVCASADADEMRRQRALAGPRPVLWTAARPGPEAAELARNLGFVRPGQIDED